MSRRSQVRWSSLALNAALVLMAGYLILSFYVPHLVAVWDSSGQPASAWQRGLAGLSAGNWVHSPLGFWGLGVVLGGCLAWRIVAGLRLGR